MTTILRTPALQKAYHEYLDTIPENICPLCDGLHTTIQTWNHWLLVKNDFPYDKIVQTHLMLVTKRHITEDTMTAEEFNELRSIKKELFSNPDFDMLIENTQPHKTIKDHFHLHLIHLREDL